MKEKIKLAKIDKLLRKLREFNDLDLKNIILVDYQGNEIEFTDECLEEWKFIGLSNKDFIDGRYWAVQG